MGLSIFKLKRKEKLFGFASLKKYQPNEKNSPNLVVCRSAFSDMLTGRVNFSRKKHENAAQDMG